MIETCEDIQPGDTVRFHGISVDVPAGSIGTVLEKHDPRRSRENYYWVHWWAIDERYCTRGAAMVVLERSDGRDI